MIGKLTQNLLKKLFNYRDGELYWKVVKGTAKIGDRAGTILPSGYRQIKINGKKYYAHRIIFLYHHGYLPKYLDHIDNDPTNNNINNLREATLSQNQQNKKKQEFINGKPTSSKFKGVTWNKRDKKWLAYIKIDGKQKYLGYFTSEIEAAFASDKALIKRDGKFAKTNAMLYPEILKTLRF